MVAIAIRRAAWLAGAVLSCAAAPVFGQDRPSTETAPPAAEPPTPERRVDIMRYRIEGNSVLPRVPVERSVMPYLGKQRPLSDIEGARAALEKLYRANGYEAVSVEIPQQDVRGGVVRLKVVELAVGTLRVVNARHFSAKNIEKRVPSLAPGSTPNYNDVARELSLLNRTADRTITPTLRAGVSPDTVDVDLTVEDRLPLHGSIEVNDRQSARTRRHRISAAISYANLWGLEHSINLQGQFAPAAPDESWVASASYVAPLTGTPFTLLAYGVHSRSDVSAVGGIDVLGSGDIVGARVLYNATSGSGTKQWFHQFTLGLDYKNFRENLTVVAKDDPTGSVEARTPINYVPISAQYSATRRSERSQLSLGATVTAGLRGLSADNAEFRAKRNNASPNWVHLRLDFEYGYHITSDWRFGVKLSGQLAPQNLIANEQFSIGGLDSVRGYYESHELGDQGISGQFQIDSPSFHEGSYDWVNEARLFAFVDGGAIWYRDALDAQESATQIGSAGAGITLRLFDRLNSTTVLAVPFTDRERVRTDIGGAVRALMRLSAAF